MICTARLTPACESWVGLALLGVLSLPAARHALESSMTLHMLVQYPLLALSGIFLAGAFPSLWRRHVNAWNAYGIAGLFATALVMAVLMIPRALDLALVDARIEFAKMIALVLCGMALRFSWRPAGLLVQGFFLGNVLPMVAAAGQLYHDSPARVCNAYLLDDQMGLGGMLVGVTVAVGLAWLSQFVVAMMRREAAATLPPNTGSMPRDPVRKKLPGKKNVEKVV